AKGVVGLLWKVIPNLGGGSGAVPAIPQGEPWTTQFDNVFLEYAVDLSQAGDKTLQLHMVPTLETSGGVGIRIGVSLDDGPMKVLTMRLTPAPGPVTTQEQRNWTQAVIDNDFVLE